jgi:uncharacterized membrane protein
VGTLAGSRTVEVQAPAARCYAIAADLERAPQWQRSLRAVEVLERDGVGRPTLARTEWDAGVRTIHAELRVAYEPGRIAFRQERGDVKALSAAWTIEDLGSDRARVTYELAADPGMVLGLLLRGPAEEAVREHLLGGAVEGLRERAQAG